MVSLKPVAGVVVTRYQVTQPSLPPASLFLLLVYFVVYKVPGKR